MIATLILTKVKLLLKKYWIILVSGLLACLSLLAWVFMRPSKKPPVRVLIKDKTEETHRRIAEVEAKAAVEIGRAQGLEEATKKEVENIQREPSNRKRRERLAALLARY